MDEDRLLNREKEKVANMTFAIPTPDEKITYFKEATEILSLTLGKTFLKKKE